MSAENMSPEDKALAEIEERRSKRREETAAAKKKQSVIDMTALDDLEAQHGEAKLKALYTPGYHEGLPTIVIVKSPGGTSFWQRFQDNVRKAKGNKQMEAEAEKQLARSCLVYPADAEVLKAMCDAFPNLLSDAAGAAAELGKLDSEEEKKG